jgi:hypothetical protein
MIRPMQVRSPIDAIRRIEGLEHLLRDLARARTPAAAENAVAYAMPDLVDATWATLYLSDDGMPPVVYGDDGWHQLAMAALAAGCVCSASDDGVVTLALPIFGPVGVTGVLLLCRDGGFDDDDLSLLELFADHASTALRRLASRAAA